MRKTLFLFILCFSVILVSCNNNEEVQKETYIKEGVRITIRSLNEWHKFNYDGSYTDNCKSFLSMIIEGSSEFEEFKTVKLSDFELIRDEKLYGYDIAFNFTVAESALDTLPVGSYNTIIKDSVDCYITFIGVSPLNSDVKDLSPSEKAICDWINSTYSWSVPEKGKLTDEMQLRCLNYFINRYGDGKRIADYKFKELLYEKLGATANDDVFKELYTVENKELYIKKNALIGNASFAVIKEETANDITTVTVQFFADCNGFIKSDIIEYYIDKNERILGCERKTISNYRPYGVANEFGKRW